MPFTATAAAIMGGSALLGNIFNHASTKSSNNMNLRIAQMNNEWSEKMMEKQNQMNIDQWNREKEFALEQREYDSAANQAQRFRDAGLNPSLMMGSGNAGSAASTPSGGSVGLPSPSSATMQPVRYDFTGFADAILGIVEMQKAQEELESMQLQNDFYRKSLEYRIGQQYEEYRAKKYDTDFRQSMESVRAGTENEQYLTALTNRLIGEENIKLLKQTEAMNQIQLTHLDSRMQAEIALMIAQKDNLSLPEFAKELKFFEKRFGQKISKQDLKTIFDVWKQKKYSLEYDNPWSLISGGISGSINRFKNR